MAIIDKKGRLFGKLSIIDLAIVLVLILVVGVGYTMFFAGGKNVDSTNNLVEYDIEITLKTKEYADVIKVGDDIRDSVKGNYLGKVIDVQVMPSTKVTEDLENGKYIQAEVPNRYDIVLTLEANGMVTSSSIAAEGSQIAVGKRMYIKGKGYASEGYILAIRYEE